MCTWHVRCNSSICGKLVTFRGTCTVVLGAPYESKVVTPVYFVESNWLYFHAS